MGDVNVDNYLENEEKKRQAAKLKFMGFEPAFDKYKFESFEVSDGSKNNFEACIKFVDKPFNLFVYGGPGCGKTRLAWTAFCSACLNRGVLGRFISWETFETGVAKDFDNRNLAFQDHLLELSFVVLDDILREKPGKLTETALVRFVEKWAARKKKGLIITCNDNLDTLSSKISNDRLPSRLCETVDLFVENTAPDYRVRNLKQKTVKAGQQLTFDF